MSRRQSDRWFVNLALFGIAVILLATLLFDSYRKSQGEGTLGNILPSKITQVKIIRPGKQTIEFSRQSDYWEMQSPIQGRADDAVLQRVLSITDLEIVSQLSHDNLKLENFGLQSPQANLIINDTAIGFGDLQPVNKLRYLLIDNAIYLVADQNMSQLNTGSVSYIDRHLVPVGDMVQEIIINGSSIKLTDSIKTQWQLTKANWISHINEADTTPEAGVKVQIRLQNQSAVIEYLAIKRETALVLVRNELEYHLGHNSIDALGLPLASP